MNPSRLPAVLVALLLCLGLLALPGDGSGAVRRNKGETPSGKASPSAKKSRKKGKAKPSAPRRRSKTSPKAQRVAAPPPKNPAPPFDAESLRPVSLEMSAGALDPFYRDLAELETARGAGGAAKVVRILHFGDSHVAADYWSGELRWMLQQRFGDAGVGTVMPGRPWKYFRNALAKSLDGEGWHTVGLKDPPRDGVLGLSGAALLPTRETPASVLAPGRNFTVTLASESDVSPFRLLLDGVPFDNVSVRSRWINSGGADVALRSISNRDPLPEASRKLSVLLAPGNGTRLLGAEFTNGQSGIILDTLGLNGARITALEKWSPRMRRHLLQEARPSLVIVSYGTNEIAAPRFTFEGFRADCVRVLRALRDDSGGAPVLVTGPADRAERKKGGWSVLSGAERPVVRALREAAAETGCIFWDLQAAMGGEGSILSWMRSGLAQPDGVHLTQRGYELQGRMLFDRLTAAYESTRSPAAPATDNNPAR